jgi:hypothetical protein
MRLSKKALKILESMSESEKASIFIKAGLGYALHHDVKPEGMEDLTDTGFNLLRAVIIGDLINIIAETLVPKGKPPSTTDLINLFNSIMSFQSECCKDIEKYHKRFVTMVETIAAKPESMSSTKH